MHGAMYAYKRPKFFSLKICIIGISWLMVPSFYPFYTSSASLVRYMPNRLTNIFCAITTTRHCFHWAFRNRSKNECDGVFPSRILSTPQNNLQRATRWSLVSLLCAPGHVHSCYNVTCLFIIWHSLFSSQLLVLPAS